MNGADLTINGDGTDSLDFTYIDDLTQGVSLALCRSEAINEVFNVTFGQGRQINELAQIVVERFPDVNIVYKPKDNLMPERGTLNIDKARSLLGYEPKYDIEKGFNNYIAWYLDFAKRNSTLDTN